MRTPNFYFSVGPCLNTSGQCQSSYWTVGSITYTNIEYQHITLKSKCRKTVCINHNLAHTLLHVPKCKHLPNASRDREFARLLLFTRKTSNNLEDSNSRLTFGRPFAQIVGLQRANTRHQHTQYIHYHQPTSNITRQQPRSVQAAAAAASSQASSSTHDQGRPGSQYTHSSITLIVQHDDYHSRPRAYPRFWQEEHL